MNANAPRVVVVGSGFAGFFAARTIERRLPLGAAELTIISATAHLCYSPLPPEVAAGRLVPCRSRCLRTVHYGGLEYCKGSSTPWISMRAP